MFAGVTDPSEYLSSGWISLIAAGIEMALDNEVIDGVVGALAEILECFCSEDIWIYFYLTQWILTLMTPWIAL